MSRAAGDELFAALAASVGQIVKNRAQGRPDHAEASESEDDVTSSDSDTSDEEEGKEAKKKKPEPLTDEEFLRKEGVTFETRAERQRFSRLRKTIPACSTETTRSIIRDVKRFIAWMEQEPDIGEQEINESRTPEKIGELFEEFLTHHADHGKSNDPDFSRIAGTTLDRMVYNFQAAVLMFIAGDTPQQVTDKILKELSAAANQIIDKKNLARPVSPQGVLGRDSVKILLEEILKRSAAKEAGDEKVVATQKALLINAEMFCGTRIGGLLASPGYEEEYIKWQDIKLFRSRDPDTMQVIGLECEILLLHFKGYQEGGSRARHHTEHRVRDVYKRKNTIFALCWYVLAHAINTGQVQIPEGHTLQSWLDQPVTNDNPDDFLAFTRLDEPVFFRIGPKGQVLEIPAPFTSKGAHTMTKTLLRRTGIISGVSKTKTSLYGIRKHVLDTHLQKYGESAAKLLAGHTQRSTTLRSNYSQEGTRISVTAAATGEDASVIPQTAAANRLVHAPPPLPSGTLHTHDPELAVYQEMHRLLTECLGSGAEVWKLSPGFRNLPNVASMNTQDALELLDKLERIIRNKHRRLRTQEVKGKLDNPTSLQRPTTVDRAAREREAEQESTLTSGIDLKQLISALGQADEEKESGEKADERSHPEEPDQDEDVALGSVRQRKTVVDLEQIIEEEEALEQVMEHETGRAASEGEDNFAPADSASNTAAATEESEAAPELSKREAFKLKILYTEQVLLKPSIVLKYKQQDTEQAVGSEDGDITATESADSFIADPAGGAKGTCRLCLMDSTVEKEEKAVLRTRSAHQTHVKRGDDPMSDSTFHSPRRRLMRLLGARGLDLKTGDEKRPCTLQPRRRVQDSSGSESCTSDSDESPPVLAPASGAGQCRILVDRPMLLPHIASHHRNELPADLRDWLRQWRKHDKAAGKRRKGNYEKKRADVAAQKATSNLQSTLHAVPDLPADYDVRSATNVWPPPSTTAAVRELLSPSRRWAGDDSYSPPSPNDDDPVRAQLGQRLQELAAQVPSGLVKDGLVLLPEDTLASLEAAMAVWPEVDENWASAGFLQSLVPPHLRETFNQATEDLI